MMHGLRLSLAALLTLATFGAGPEAAPPTATAPKNESRSISRRIARSMTSSSQLSRGKRPIEGVRGRILYDFTGNPCEGYALQFRQVSELNTGEGSNLFTDLRAATWEDGEAKSFRFNSQNYMNEKLVDSVDGRAERKGTGLGIKLTKPAGKTVEHDRDADFPDRAYAPDHRRRARRRHGGGRAGV